MVKKTEIEENSHDKCVRQIAEKLRTDKWKVKTTLGSRNKPDKIGKFTPDIEAEKGCLRRFCEVLTEKDFEGDMQRYVEFKNYCDEYDFHFYIVGKNGKRQEIDPHNFGKKTAQTVRDGQKQK
jgi:hypothetical protein